MMTMRQWMWTTVLMAPARPRSGRVDGNYEENLTKDVKERLRV